VVWELNKSRTLIGVALPHKSSDLGHALERLRKNFYHLWQVLEELRSAPPQYSPPDALLREWRRVPKPSQEWRKALFYEHAVDVLAVALGLSREETEEVVRQHVFLSR
jgi:hypothetical protein